MKCEMAVLLIFSFVGFPLSGNQSKDHGKSKDQETCQSYLNVRMPNYKIARLIRGDTGPVLDVYVAMKPRDIIREKLLVIGCKLGMKYAKEQTLFVYVFDDPRAAKRFNPQGEGNDRATNLSYRAVYSFSREPGYGYGQSLAWKPDRNDPDHWVNIDLGGPPK